MPNKFNRVLVTGCAGFIGSHLCEKLIEMGVYVIGIDSMHPYYDLKQKEHNISILKETEKKKLHSRGSSSSQSLFVFHQADICDQKIMEEIFINEQPEAVCHLAARAGVRQSLEEPASYIQTNVQGTTTLLDLSQKYKIQNFVYASSSSVYGSNKKVPFCETDPIESMVSPYAATKRTCEIMASTYHNLYKLNVTGLRFFTVYGPRGRPDMAPFKFVERVHQSKPIEKFGDGSSLRDYTYIDDIIKGVIMAIENPHPCEIINLGNSRLVSLNEFISVVETCLQKKASIVQLPDQPGDVMVTFADCGKAEKLLGYKPQWNISEGMKKFVEWYLGYKELLSHQKVLEG